MSAFQEDDHKDDGGWLATAWKTPEAIGRMIERAVQRVTERDAVLNPVLDGFVAHVDPEFVPKTFDLSRAETRGEAVNVDEYPKGTYFYYAPDYVYVRESGASHIARREAR